MRFTVLVSIKDNVASHSAQVNDNIYISVSTVVPNIYMCLNELHVAEEMTLCHDL